MKRRYLVITLIVLSFASLFIGVTNISPMDMFNLDNKQTQIFLQSRVPRLASIIIAGISLSISGLIMQQLSRNKFVSPTTAGTMDSAKLGILISLLIFTQATMIEKMIVAFAFSLLGTFIFMKILERIKFKDAIFIPLVGLMFGSIVSSITTFFAYRYDLIQNISAWLQGDFSMVI
ncbi:MAG TPA: iron chelate uptake ABC transporter family permease subunit, partial [Chondromyces sp.]|nr:iron chelate uptake ABC transporter family permease subunit [Chondromyces sp.]